MQLLPLLQRQKGQPSQARKDSHGAEALRLRHTRQGLYSAEPAGQAPESGRTKGPSVGSGSRTWRHKSTHTEERFHVCAECGASFTQRGDMIRHARAHSGDRVYLWHPCGHRSADSRHLKKHVIAVHSKEYPCTCECCGKGFMALSATQFRSTPSWTTRAETFLCASLTYLPVFEGAVA